MNAQPGWYDAGVPGRQRWWDGTQWSVHERETAEQPVQPAVQYAAAQPMGWFPVVGTGDVRWWDGAGWTPYRLRDGRPRPDAFAIEPGATGLALGFMFITLGFVQFGTYNLSGQPFFSITPVLFFISGAVWLVGGFQTNRLRSLPAPRTVPVFDPSTRPLPGEVENVGAGWYPVSGQVARWWTGNQWSWYVAQKYGVRPTHSGPRGYRVAMILGWILIAVGVSGILLGLFAMPALGTPIGLTFAVPGVVLAVAGGLVLPLVHTRRYTMILPTKAPPLH